MAGYIYSVYDRGLSGRRYQVHRVAIKKETSRQVVTVGAGLAFGCSTRHDPAKVHRSPQAARDAFKSELLEQHARLVDRLAKIDQLLPTVATLPEAEEEDR